MKRTTQTSYKHLSNNETHVKTASNAIVSDNPRALFAFFGGLIASWWVAQRWRLCWSLIMNRSCDLAEDRPLPPEINHPTPKPAFFFWGDLSFHQNSPNIFALKIFEATTVAVLSHDRLFGFCHVSLGNTTCSTNRPTHSRWGFAEALTPTY